ncbi:MAG: hypothetical protein RMJ67_04095 [Elusimicrobiota bacterium]|nr:hypothetical protein [Endomicrobiia bacterium]MDW8165673.1 hypothetical protein [Elusimicrobiota bacterium]
MKLIKLILLLFTTNLCFSFIKNVGTDIYNIISDARIGFGGSYEYLSYGSEFSGREDINFSLLNTNSLRTYYGHYYSFEKYSYYISARPTSRLSLKLNYEYITPHTIWVRELFSLSRYTEKTSQLDIEYFISPRWSLYAVILNKVEDNSLDTLLFEPSLVVNKDNTEYRLTKVNSDSVTIGTKFTVDWGQFNVYNTILDAYNYLPNLEGTHPDYVKLSYSNNSDNFLTKGNKFGIEYYLNPAVKLDISGSFRDEVTISNKPDDTFETVMFTEYPFEVKYRLTDIWELGVKVNNNRFKFVYETRSKVFTNQMEVWEIIKNNYEKKNSYLLLSINRYFKYQGLNLYGRFKRYTEDTIYEYHENILYGREKSSLWSRWDESVKGNSLEFGFFYRPTEKIYVSAGLVYELPTTYRKPDPSEYTKSFYDYTFSAFYKPTTLFEIKVSKGYKNLTNDYEVPQNIPVQLRQSDIWRIEKVSFSEIEEKEAVGIALRTLSFVFDISLQQVSLGKTYYKSEDVLLLDRFVHPWAFLDIYRKFISYNIGYSYITQALFSQSQLTLSGGIYYVPDYSFDKGDGSVVTIREYSYLFSARYEFTPNFYIECSVEEGHYFEKSRDLRLANIGSVLANDEFHSYQQKYKINLVYRP